MAHIVIPPGKWQIVSVRSCVFKVDNATDTADTTLALGDETKLPLVVQNLATSAVHQLNQGDAPAAANLVAGGLASATLPTITVDEAQKRASTATTTCARDRSARLLPVVGEAQKLLRWAATNGREVDEEVRNTIVATADAFGREAATVDDEQKLLKAYQALTVKLAPVSAATLDASMQRLPPLGSLFKFDGNNYFARLSGMTFGRFAHAVFFIVVLLAAAVALSYQTIGSSALGRYKTLADDIAKLSEEEVKQKGVLRDRQTIFEQSRKGDPDAQSTRAASDALQLAVDELALKSTLKSQLVLEQASMPKKLKKWLRWSESDSPAVVEIIDGATTTLDQFNRIVLPLLFGLLGSYSYILRSISIEIRAQQFAPHSALHHIARLSLGALAGIAATWLLTPDKVGLSSTLPLWTLAFVAGYGTELVFAFMDRIVSAFKA